jgi:hypothetical protein
MFLRFERAKIKPPVGGAVSYLHFEGHGMGFGPRPLGSLKIADGEYPTLRLERHGDDFFALIGAGNGIWSMIGYVRVSSPGEIAVGVGAVNNTKEPFAVTFGRVRFFLPAAA